MSDSNQGLMPLPKTPKTRLRRAPARAIFDRQALYDIFDETLLGHIGFQQSGESIVIPMSVWRWDNRLLIHSSRGGRLIKMLCSGQQVCVSAAILDGMVMSKSAFHHSANYRSAVVFGEFYPLESDEEIEKAFEVFIEQVSPGRWPHLRPINKKEMAATSVLAMDINEASVKMRTGGPSDHEADLDLPVWAGELQLRQKLTATVAADYSHDDCPDYSAGWGERWSV